MNPITKHRLLLTVALASLALTACDGDITNPVVEEVVEQPIPVVLTPFETTEYGIDAGQDGANIMHFFAPAGVAPVINVAASGNILTFYRNPQLIGQMPVGCTSQCKTMDWKLVVYFNAKEVGTSVVTASLESTGQKSSFTVTSANPIIADIRANGENGTILIGNGEMFNASWSAFQSKSCQLTVADTTSGVSFFGSFEIYYGDPWYPTRGKPTTFILTCTDGKFTASDQVTVAVRP